MASSLRMPATALAGAPGGRALRTAALRFGASRPAGARRVVLRRSQSNNDKLDLDRVAKIEEEITRQARARERPRTAAAHKPRLAAAHGSSGSQAAPAALQHRALT